MNTDLISVLLSTARRQKVDLWLVGGPVRDALLGRPYDDWDMVCRKAGFVARQAASKLRAKFIVLDEQNRIYRVILKQSNPSVRTLDFAELQGRSIEEDLARRDFTINAMARLFPSGDLVDPFQGCRDLKKGIIRAVSEKAFSDDPLRLLRAFRFQAQFQFALDSRTRLWIRKHRQRLSKISAERIREELLRLWRERNAVSSLKAMDAVGLLAQVFPEMEPCRRSAVRYYGRGGVLKHSFETVENLEWILEQICHYGETAVTAGPPSRRTPPLWQALPLRQLPPYLAASLGGYPRHAWLKWAAFLHDIGKPATAKVIKGRLRFYEHEHVGAAQAMRLAQRLRCSRQETQFLGLCVRNHMRLGNLAAATRITGKAPSRFFRDLGEEGIGMILVSLADHYTYLSRSTRGKGKDPVEAMALRLFDSYYTQRSRILPARLVNGHDLMRTLKLKPGPVIGRLLEKIQDAQAEGKVSTREEALQFARRQGPRN